jgi:hypothetical protein
MTMRDVIPDAMEPVIAWRAWIVNGSRDGPRLRSMNGALWRPRQPMVAVCRQRHEPPGAHCVCGLYAASGESRLIDLGYQDYGRRRGEVACMGTVALWGGIVPAEFGYRAQYGYPQKLWVPFELARVADRLEDEYGVVIRLRNNLKLGRIEDEDEEDW